MQVESILSPKLFYQVENVDNKVVVVIDILRATSTITTILNNGASSVIPAMSESEAQEYKEKGYLVGGERGGDTIPGFDFGNSPFHYKPELVRAKNVVLTTTNGTKCIEMAKNAKRLIIGSFLNLEAVVKKLKAWDRDVVLFCAGWKDRTNLEDSLYAGAVASLLEDAELDDATILVKDSYLSSRHNLFGTLKSSNHFKRLESKGVTKDIEYCCKLNIIDTVPILSNNKLVIK
ncbi:MAG: 2-phosphosulfolactate phosphatase [Bacteroidia bacterium]